MFANFMEIQHKDEERSSDSSDSWEPKQFQTTSKPKPTLFQKLTIHYDDQTIEKNIDLQCENPIINSQLFPFQDEQNDEIINIDQTQQEPSENLGNKEKMKSQQQRSKQNSKPMDREEALFNPIQDDQNENWMRKRIRKDFVETSKASRPLTCPQCFTQICYRYEICRKPQKDSRNEEESEPTNKLASSSKTYRAKVVDNVEIHEHKIIRNRFCAQSMRKQQNFETKQTGEKAVDKKLQAYEKQLRQRYDDINVKILISCSQCQLEIGYWDANEQIYVLFNVI